MSEEPDLSTYTRVVGPMATKAYKLIYDEALAHLAQQASEAAQLRTVAVGAAAFAATLLLRRLAPATKVGLAQSPGLG